MKLPPHLSPYAQEILAASIETGVDALLIAAVIDRESRGGLALTPRGPGGKGDGGHGHGLMQIDDRTWGNWLATNDWTRPAVNILKGAEILAENLRRFDDDERSAVAAYNCGPGNVRIALRRGEDVDIRTAGRDYSRDVLRRRELFRNLSTKEPS